MSSAKPRPGTARFRTQAGTAQAGTAQPRATAPRTARPRWFFLITPRWLAWHAFAVFAAWGMLWLGDWQFHRAEGGNALSWAYTFEWPIFTIFGVIFWAKTIIDEYRSPRDAVTSAAVTPAAGTGAGSLAPAGEALPGRAHTAVAEDEQAGDDPELAAYNAYLARLNSRTPAQ